ncbi:outer membrane receptor protein [Mycobacteroides abscessus subsp. abscessus]|nr:outer membrane receptor protein [Mycobacteroides abscessus subsp. abscessus]
MGSTSSDGTQMSRTGEPIVVTALGGTVTSTTSVRYGDIAGPPRAHQLELRASWTAPTADGLGGHLEAFCEVLSSAAGLPPVGITELGSV